MYPRTTDIMKSIQWTFEEYIVPEMTSPYAKSMVLTLGNLMRHATLRVDLEGKALFDDNLELRHLLADIREYLDRQDRPIAEIKTALAMQLIEPGAYPETTLLIEEAKNLRSALSAAILSLHDLRESQGDNPDYQATRAAVRTYLGNQLAREGAMIEPAFTVARR
ncbi:MAG: hypothetical protein HOC70_14385 [Gammaproteobacteria bacterium]|jgi:hypothetical protein|nr:hypothetical protein [Gammaproteobacteria bacterium]MBT4494426.1 hypothetical protein [Gammaproteobacteria bacterium]MBT7369562.1 hypothetical protein [Gammaproteobacteria bacterium]